MSAVPASLLLKQPMDEDAPGACSRYRHNNAKCTVHPSTPIDCFSSVIGPNLFKSFFQDLSGLAPRLFHS